MHACACRIPLCWTLLDSHFWTQTFGQFYEGDNSVCMELIRYVEIKISVKEKFHCYYCIVAIRHIILLLYT